MGEVQPVEMELYLCGVIAARHLESVLSQGGAVAKNGWGGGWTEDLTGYSSHKYQEARVRVYPFYHIRQVVGEVAQ